MVTKQCIIALLILCINSAMHGSSSAPKITAQQNLIEIRLEGDALKAKIRDSTRKINEITHKLKDKNLQEIQQKLQQLDNDPYSTLIRDRHHHIPDDQPLQRLFNQYLYTLPKNKTENPEKGSDNALTDYLNQHKPQGITPLQITDFVKNIQQQITQKKTALNATLQLQKDLDTETTQLQTLKQQHNDLLTKEKEMHAKLYPANPQESAQEAQQKLAEFNKNPYNDLLVSEPYASYTIQENKEFYAVLHKYAQGINQKTHLTSQELSGEAFFGNISHGGYDGDLHTSRDNSFAKDASQKLKDLIKTRRTQLKQNVAQAEARETTTKTDETQPSSTPQINTPPTSPEAKVPIITQQPRPTITTEHTPTTQPIKPKTLFQRFKEFFRRSPTTNIAKQSTKTKTRFQRFKEFFLKSQHEVHHEPTNISGSHGEQM